MKITSYMKHAVAGVAFIGAMQAHAAGTDTNAGTTVNNTATATYNAGGVTGATANSNQDQFLVDRRVNLSVAETGGVATTTTAGGLDQVLTFTVTNTTNGLLDIALSPVARVGGTLYGNTDNFNANNVRVFVDFNANGTYDAGTDVATFINDLAEDATVTVFILADIPNGQANGSAAIYDLLATAADPAGADATDTLVETAAADVAATVENVFADAAGTATGDAAEDGKASDDDVYVVQNAVITVSKYSRVLSDPFTNVAANAKRIPGAVIEYCVAVRNAGAAPATSVVVTDTLSAELNPAGSDIDFGTVADTTSVTDAATCSAEADTSGGGSFAGQLFTSSTVTVGPNSTHVVKFTVTLQ